MKNKTYWIEWAKKAGVRAVKTVAQAAVAGIGTAAVMGQVDWRYVLSASLLAGVLSLLTSVAGLPELDRNVAYHQAVLDGKVQAEGIPTIVSGQAKGVHTEDIHAEGEYAKVAVTGESEE